jgi:hypothetical protein
MPRCLHLHKVPPTIGFCAVCGARVLPEWVWVCLCALPLALLYGTAVSLRAEPPPMVETHIITATESAPTPTRPVPTVTLAPIWAFISTPSPIWTPTFSPSPTTSATPTATLIPRVALLSFHDLYITAKGEDNDWVLRQETKLDEKCGWFTQIRQDNGNVALLTCYNRYVTAPRTGITRRDWLLRQEFNLDDCGKFIIHDLGGGDVAFESCAGRYFTAGNDTWTGTQWLVVAETENLLAWERFRLQQP